MEIRLNDAIGSCKGGETYVLQASGETQTLTLRVQADDQVKGD
jgi:hypothetical protein